MQVVLFCHSLLSDWNHGNAHFLRGVVTELVRRGHRVRSYEPRHGWSIQNLLREHGGLPLQALRRAYPDLGRVQLERYEGTSPDLDAALAGADLVLVHEWNENELVREVGRRRAAGGRFRLLFHDTHHRSVTQPEEMARYELDGYDGVLAFGEAVRQVYLQRGWARRVWTWHEAADVGLFYPRASAKEADLVWIGNWGDEERTAELQEFLIGPVQGLGLSANVFGVRYPKEGQEALALAGMTHGGWLPNFQVPEAYARHRLTIHVPRRPYTAALRGIPTIRVFEALACGVPLVSAPWLDVEGLFRSGIDYLQVRSGQEMGEALRGLLAEPARAAELARCGRESILARHTCGHRVDQLLAVAGELGLEGLRAAPAIPA